MKACPANQRQNSSKLIIFSLLVLFSDQTFKFFAVNKILPIEFNSNSGVLFGIQIDTALIFTFFIIFAGIALFNFKKINLFKNDIFASGAFYLMLGGIVGNLLDRILYGFIVDYLNLFGLFSFNLADLAICSGALILGWKVFKK